MALSFLHDQFHWESGGRRFLLLEPPALFDEPPDRMTVQASRNNEGWVLVYTHKFAEGDELGVVDLWSRSDQA